MENHGAFLQLLFIIKHVKKVLIPPFYDRLTSQAKGRFCLSIHAINFNVTVMSSRVDIFGGKYLCDLSLGCTIFFPLGRCIKNSIANLFTGKPVLHVAA